MLCSIWSGFSPSMDVSLPSMVSSALTAALIPSPECLMCMILTAHPVGYLYTTLHYYEQSLRERPQWKRQMVATVMGECGRTPHSIILVSFSFPVQAHSTEYILWNGEGLCVYDVGALHRLRIASAGFSLRYSVNTCGPGNQAGPRLFTTTPLYWSSY